MPEPHRIRLAGPWQIQVRGFKLTEGTPPKDLPVIAALESQKWQLPIRTADILKVLSTLNWSTPVEQSQPLEIVAVRGFHRPNGLSDTTQVILAIQFQEKINAVRLNGNSLDLPEDSSLRLRFDVTQALPPGFNRLEISLFEMAAIEPKSPDSTLETVVLEIFEHS
jgi:hypothetical protein